MIDQKIILETFRAKIEFLGIECHLGPFMRYKVVFIDPHSFSLASEA